MDMQSILCTFLPIKHFLGIDLKPTLPPVCFKFWFEVWLLEPVQVCAHVAPTLSAGGHQTSRQTRGRKGLPGLIFVVSQISRIKR